MVLCPICSTSISLNHINAHLDECEVRFKSKVIKEETDATAGDAQQKPVLNSIPQMTQDGINAKEDQMKGSEPSGKSEDGVKTSLSLLLSGKKSKNKQDKPRTYQYQPSQLHSQAQSVSQPQSRDSSFELPSGYAPKKRTIHEVEPIPSSPPSDTKRNKTAAIERLRITSNLPLPERLRPTDISQYIGQAHLVGERGILRGYLKNGKIPSLILWGYPGTGKTTLARILAKTAHLRVVEMSGVMNGVSDCKKVFEEAQNEYKLTRRPTIIFVDEIHRFSKSQQDVFLGYVERGLIILIGATTENPSFTVNKALLSRCRVFVLEKLNNEEMKLLIGRGIVEINKVRKLIYDTNVIKLAPDAIDWVVSVADGDGRLALGCIESIDSSCLKETKESDSSSIEINAEQVKEILKKCTVLYDRVGDAHYDTISAFHKSIRGSNPDAAMYYLARMLKGGEDPLYIARRMIRIASEDVGVLDDSCLPFAVSAYQAVQFVGLPEADLALVHCAVKLARAPKSIEIYRGWKEMKAFLEEPGIEGAEIPLHIRNAPTKLMNDLGYGKGYKYNPNYKNGRVKQTYFPDSIGERVFLKHQHLGSEIDPDFRGEQ